MKKEESRTCVRFKKALSEMQIQQYQTLVDFNSVFNSHLLLNKIIVNLLNY